MHRLGVAERRARLGIRHHLASGALAATPAEAAEGVVALHATDPASVFLSVWARTRDVPVDGIEHALYQERSLIRLLGMRRTMFVVPVELAPVVQAACGKALAAQQRKRYLQLMEAASVFPAGGVGGAGDQERGGPAWLKEIEESTAQALAARGAATGAQLSQDEPRLRTPIVMAEGKAYQSTQNITTWVLLLLAAEGRIVRGRPRGSWVSTQWLWSPIEAWLPGGMPELPADQARVQLVRRWLAAFGPGTVADLRWWTGWTAAHVKQALTVIDPVEVDLDGQPGLVLPGDEAPVPAPEPWVALLPALDPTGMGWQSRDWYLGPHAPQLFDRSGNIGPSIWCDGRIVGGWAQRKDGEIVWRLLEDVGGEAVTGIEAAAQRLAAWIGEVRVVPRFRTPLERELAA